MDGTPLHPPGIYRESYGVDESRCNTVERITRRINADKSCQAFGSAKPEGADYEWTSVLSAHAASGAEMIAGSGDATELGGEFSGGEASLRSNLALNFTRLCAAQSRDAGIGEPLF
jgi:hypothetical protein